MQYYSKSMNWNKVEVGPPNAEEWSRIIKFHERNGFKKKGLN